MSPRPLRDAAEFWFGVGTVSRGPSQLPCPFGRKITNHLGAANIWGINVRKVPGELPQLYNEEILDLFDSTRDPDSRHRKSNIKIHEDASGGIYTTGVTSRLINSQEEVRSVGPPPPRLPPSLWSLSSPLLPTCS